MALELQYIGWGVKFMPLTVAARRKSPTLEWGLKPRVQAQALTALYLCLLSTGEVNHVLRRW